MPLADNRKMTSTRQAPKVRLTQEQLQAIKEEARSIFGTDVQIWLFGSRTNPDARGGDIDLYIETDGPSKEALQKELRLHSRLLQRLGDQKIDIIVHRKGTPYLPIHQEALEEGVPL